jgi:hypothetical protein
VQANARAAEWSSSAVDLAEIDALAQIATA